MNVVIFKWFFSWVSQYFKYQAQKLCESFICIFSVFIGQKCCVHAHLHVPPIRAGMRDTCMNPVVEFTVFRIVFYEILVLLGINFITKTEYFILFRLWFYFRIQHMITPKAGTRVGLLTFRTIRFLHFRYVERIVNYSVLTQTVPRINFIKLSDSQVNIFIIFITLLSGEFQYWCRHNYQNVGHSNE